MKNKMLRAVATVRCHLNAASGGSSPLTLLVHSTGRLPPHGCFGVGRMRKQADPRNLGAASGIYDIASPWELGRRVHREDAPMFDRISRRMTARSAAVLLTIDNRLDRVLKW